MIDSCLEMLYEPEMEVRMEALTRLQAEGKAAIAPLFNILTANDTQDVPAKWTTREERAAALERAQQVAADALLAMEELFIQELTRRLLELNTLGEHSELKRLCKRVGEPLVTPLIQLLNWNVEDQRSIHARLKRKYGVLLPRYRLQNARSSVLSALAAIESGRVAAYLRNCSDNCALANERAWRVGGAVAGMFALFAVFLLKTIATDTMSWVLGFGSLVFAGISVLLIVVTWIEVQGRKDETAKLLGTLSNPFLVGIAASYLNSKDKHLREATKWDLTCLLPRLRAEHQGLFTPDEMNALLAELRFLNNTRESSEFILIVLNALRYVGNASALPYLRRMMARQNEIPSPVIIAARECLACVEQRVEEASRVDTLLRASSAAAAPATLLRAALGTDWQASNAEERHQLLRPC